jgi:hypothetical protein
MRIALFHSTLGLRDVEPSSMGGSRGRSRKAWR